MLARNEAPAVGEPFVAAAQTQAPGTRTRLVARLRAGGLDRALAAGADPLGSTALAARAARLGEPRTRAAVADQLDGLVQAARHPRGHSRIPPRRASVMANAAALGHLAELLRGPEALYVSGTAMLNDLLRDATGPAYVGTSHELTARLADADDLLRRGQPLASPRPDTVRLAARR